jgi:metal-sulfur cluster biosynthetic enzyme
MLSEEEVLQHLKKVLDPELNVNIVDLGLIYEIEITEVRKKPFVKITMTLTTPGCPLGGMITQMVRDALYPIKELNVDKNVDVAITFDPPWTIDMMTEEVRAELGFE